MAANKLLHRWLAEFADCVRTQDFNCGRRYFHPKAYCFGTYASHCNSLDSLVRRQWMKIWPNITGFGFNLKDLHYKASPDGRWVCAMVPWHSTGYRKGKAFRRDGRVTVLLMKEGRRERLLALHTHYSLNPGTAQTAIRRKAKRR